MLTVEVKDFTFKPQTLLNPQRVSANSPLLRSQHFDLGLEEDDRMTLSGDS